MLLSLLPGRANQGALVTGRGSLRGPGQVFQGRRSWMEEALPCGTQ